MNEPNESPDERIEALLRQWGDQQALGGTKVGPAPALRAQDYPRRVPMRKMLDRWLPTLSAAALLAVAVTLFAVNPYSAEMAANVNGTSRPHTAPTQAVTEQPNDALIRVSAERDKVLADLKETTRKLQATAGELDQTRQKLATMVSPEAHREAMEKSDKEILALSAEVRLKEGGIEYIQQQLAKANADLMQLDKDASQKQEAARQELAIAKKDVQDARRRQAAAAEELARMRKMYDDAFAEAQKTRMDMQELKARQGALQDDTQRAYLARLAPGDELVVASQKAAQRAEMLQRCAQLRRAATDPRTQQLLDRLEAVFTRLSLLNARSPHESSAFAAMLRKADVLGAIDVALAPGDLPADLRVFLVEARMILKEAQRVA